MQPPDMPSTQYQALQPNLLFHARHSIMLGFPLVETTDQQVTAMADPSVASHVAPQLKVDGIEDAWGPYVDFLNDGDPSIPFPVEPLDHRTLHTVAQLEGATVQLGSVGYAAQKRACELDCFDSDSDTDEAARAGGKRGKLEHNAAASKKACREKARREKLNDKFAELAKLIDPGNEPKTDKTTILVDAIKYVQQMTVENHQLKQLNKFLEERVRTYELARGQELYQQHLMQHGIPRAHTDSQSHQQSLLLQGGAGTSQLMPNIQHPSMAGVSMQGISSLSNGASTSAAVAAAAVAAAAAASAAPALAPQRCSTPGLPVGGPTPQLLQSQPSNALQLAQLQGPAQQQQQVLVSTSLLQQQQEQLQQLQAQVQAAQAQVQAQVQAQAQAQAQAHAHAQAVHAAQAQSQAMCSSQLEAASHSCGAVHGGVLMPPAQAMSPPLSIPQAASEGGSAQQQQQQHHHHHHGQQQQQVSDSGAATSPSSCDRQQQQQQQQAGTPGQQQQAGTPGQQQQQPAIGSQANALQASHQQLLQASSLQHQQVLGMGLLLQGQPGQMLQSAHMLQPQQQAGLLQMPGSVGLLGAGPMQMPQFTGMQYMQGPGMLVSKPMHMQPGPMHGMPGQVLGAGGSMSLPVGMGAMAGGLMGGGSMGLAPHMQANVQANMYTGWLPQNMLDSTHDSLMRPPAA